MSAQPRWHWRNCRSFHVMIAISLWPIARWDFWKSEDVYGGQRNIAIGPFGVSIQYDHGNASDPGVNGWFALSEAEAWERACRYERLEEL